VLMCSNKFDEYFRRAVCSVLEQSYSPIELIIVANSLSEEKLNAMRAFCVDKRIRLVNSTLTGLSANLNFGLEHCRSDLVCRMDADDISYSHRVETLKQFMDAHPEVGVCGSGYDVIDEDDGILYSRMLPESNRQIRRALYFKNPFCHPAVIFRRQWVVQLGGYSNYRFAQDFDLWLRLSDDEGFQFANVLAQLIGYRDQGADARGAVKAYLCVADAYLKKLTRSANPVYALSALIFFLKAIFKKIMGVF